MSKNTDVPIAQQMTPILYEVDVMLFTRPTYTGQESNKTWCLNLHPILDEVRDRIGVEESKLVYLIALNQALRTAFDSKYRKIALSQN
jgi:hypothetical protein